MRNFGSSPYLENPDLVEIRAATVNNKRISEFVMNVSIKRPQLEDASKAGKAGKAAPGATAVPAAAAAAKKG
jgi:type IV pilus assembly protein PilN